MRIFIDGLPVIFPYKLIFSEQEVYMKYLKRTLDAPGHAILEMPTGTGKTVCLLSLLTAYLLNSSKYKRLVYCTRTVVQMEKTLIELKNLLSMREKEVKDQKKLTCIGLTAKKNLCVHKEAKTWRQGQRVQSQCRKRTAKFTRYSKKTQEDFMNSKCEFYEGFTQKTELLEKSDCHKVYTMQDLRKYGRDKVQCPYFTARQAIKTADIIVFNYLYLLDPQISSQMVKKLSKQRDSIVVFDEAHNIDDVCLQSYTLKLNNQIVGHASTNVKQLERKLQDIKEKNSEVFKAQFIKMVEAHKQKLGRTLESQEQEDILSNYIPERISNNRLFLSSLHLIIQFLKNKLKEKCVRYYDNSELRKQMELNTNLEQEFFKLAHQKLNNLTQELEITEVEDLKFVKAITFFSQLISSYNQGFKIVFQPHPMDGDIADPLLTLSCLDASLPLQPIWKLFPSVILTSGTISPLSLYPKMLGFQPVVCKSINIQIGRNPISPIILGKTFDQQNLSSQYTARSDIKVSNAYGQLLRGLSQIVPDGILVFFPSYVYMEHILKHWKQSGVIDELINYKYMYIEKKDPTETEESLKNYRKACDIGRGGIFLAIARGKIAEGIDFQGHYGRCVIMMGFPVQNSHDPVLLQRIRFMVEQKQIVDRNQFFEFDTMRQCAQCLGRVMRRKNDYGLMILADSRFTRAGKYEKLPQWIKRCLDVQNINLTYDAVFHASANFFRKMGVPFELVKFCQFRIGNITRQRLISNRRRLRKEKQLRADSCGLQSQVLICVDRTTKVTMFK